MESLAGLARLALTLRNLGLALEQIEEVLGHLEDSTLDGTDESFRVYHSRASVLRACNDPRTQVVLIEARSLLQERAARITDEKLGKSLLENVAAHREIVAAWQEIHLDLKH